MEGPEEAAEAVNNAVAANAEVILGGVSAVKAARKLGVANTLLKTSRESILLAAKEARFVLQALQTEKAKRNMLNTVLGYAYEGIIVVDQDQRVTEFNPAAERFTQIEREKILGRNVSELLPDLKLHKVVKSGMDDLHHLLNFKGKHVLCNKVPIFLGEKVIGAVATMQDVTKIQEMEARIRREFYSKGHVARFSFDDVLGSSNVIRKAVATAGHFAQTDSNILILGETGTGKEVFAQSIHNASNRSTGPFVAINCAALPAQLLESELFGYVAGAFTGAAKTGKPGLFEVAHGGTIFLDEIAEMDYVNQGRLLRVLQEKTVIRLGSDKVLPVDVRIIAATNKNLKAMVAANKFRDDLYFRLNVLRLPIPPLRERSADIAELANFFVRRQALATNRKLSMTQAGIDYLARYSWPGNVRELQNTIERAMAVSRSDIIDETIIAQTCGDEYTFQEKENPADCGEAKEIYDALADANGRYADAAKLLGIDRTTLWRRMKKYGLSIAKKGAKV